MPARRQSEFQKILKELTRILISLGTRTIYYNLLMIVLLKKKIWIKKKLYIFVTAKNKRSVKTLFKYDSNIHYTFIVFGTIYKLWDTYDLSTCWFLSEFKKSSWSFMIHGAAFIMRPKRQECSWSLQGPANVQTYTV